MPKYNVIFKGKQARMACFLVGEEENLENIYDLIGDDSLMLIGIGGIDWNRDLSPWKAEKVFKKGDDFGGEAEKLLKYILNEVIPKIEDLPDRKIIAGYSLAGLFAVWSCFQTDKFTAVCSCSGSMWFDGFVNYVKTHKFLSKVGYFSLGDKEKNSKNPRMSRVEQTSKDITSILSINYDIMFKLVPGNHFMEPEKRLSDGISYLINH